MSPEHGEAKYRVVETGSEGQKRYRSYQAFGSEAPPPTVDQNPPVDNLSRTNITKEKATRARADAAWEAAQKSPYAQPGTHSSRTHPED